MKNNNKQTNTLTNTHKQQKKIIEVHSWSPKDTFFYAKIIATENYGYIEPLDSQ